MTTNQLCVLMTKLHFMETSRMDRGEYRTFREVQGMMVMLRMVMMMEDQDETKLHFMEISKVGRDKSKTFRKVQEMVVMLRGVRMVEYQD